MELFQSIFGTHYPFIGMVHLLPTVGYDDHPGMYDFIAHAVAEAKALEAGGVHGVLVENDRDHPHTILVSDDQKKCILEAVKAVRAAVSVPVGVDVLLNDWKAALDIAKEGGGRYVRIDVFVDRVSCDQGVIEPEADAIIAYRKKIGAEDVALFTDIQVKHKTMLDSGKQLPTSAKQAIEAGADALVITGTETGKETSLDHVREVKKVFPDMPILIGSGINASNAKEQFAVADGAIVGTALKNSEGKSDSARVQEIISIIEKI
ncbi:MAG: BtpA/SgcQ family protein [Candidatus Kerfeldbacteria bacterium]